MLIFPLIFSFCIFVEGVNSFNEDNSDNENILDLSTRIGLEIEESDLDIFKRARWTTVYNHMWDETKEYPEISNTSVAPENTFEIANDLNNWTNTSIKNASNQNIESKEPLINENLDIDSAGLINSSSPCFNISSNCTEDTLCPEIEKYNCNYSNADSSAVISGSVSLITEILKVFRNPYFIICVTAGVTIICMLIIISYLKRWRNNFDINDVKRYKESFAYNTAEDPQLKSTSQTRV